jgi:peroxiredoxin
LSSAVETASIQVGQDAPGFELKDQDGTPVSLADYRGKNVVLMFYPMAFSPTCTKELMDVKNTADRLQAAGAEVLGVSIDHKWALKAWKEQHGYTARLLADFNPRGAVGALYGAYIPELGFHKRITFVIDSRGKIAQVIDTPIADKPDPDEYLAALANCPI